MAAALAPLLLGGTAAAQSALCQDPATQCGKLLSADCLQRFGAGSVKADTDSCGRELERYRDCLAEVAATCGAARAPQSTEPAQSASAAPAAASAPEPEPEPLALTPPPGHQVLGRRDVGRTTYVIAKAPKRLRWDEALTAAQQFGGLLGSIGDAAENEEVLVLLRKSPGAFERRPLMFRAYVGPWIGAFQKSGAKEPAEGWTWVDGTPWAFESWKRREPNNLGRFEDYALLFCRDAPICVEWNDVDGMVLRSSTYLVEIQRP